MTGMLTAIRNSWAERSPRERWLLAILSLTLLGVAAWYLAAAPLIEFRNQSRAGYVDSVDRYRAIAAGIGRYQSLLDDEAVRAARDDRPLRTIVAERASARQLPLSRMVPDDAGRLNVWTENADGALLMAWLAELEQRYAIVAVRVSIDREGAGRARAQILLERGGG